MPGSRLRSCNLCILQSPEVAAPWCPALVMPKVDRCPALAEMIGDTIDDAMDDDEMEEETDNVVSAVSHLTMIFGLTGLLLEFSW